MGLVQGMLHLLNYAWVSAQRRRSLPMAGRAHLTADLIKDVHEACAEPFWALGPSLLGGRKSLLDARVHASLIECPYLANVRALGVVLLVLVLVLVLMLGVSTRPPNIIILQLRTAHRLCLWRVCACGRVARVLIMIQNRPCPSYGLKCFAFTVFGRAGRGLPAAATLSRVSAAALRGKLCPFPDLAVRDVGFARGNQP